MSNSGMMAAVAAAAGYDESVEIKIDADFVTKHFPAVAGELRASGAKAERERILGIEKAALPGHEKLIADLKYDGNKSAADAALAIIEAEKAKRATRLAALDTDETLVNGLRSEPANGQEEPKPASTNLTGEAAWKAEFEGSADLQREFRTEAQYLAFKRAEMRGAFKLMTKRNAA